MTFSAGRRIAIALFTVVLVAVGCAGGLTGKSPKVEQRTTEGLTAEQLFTYRTLRQNRREPTFEEKLTWRDGLDQRIRDYLNRHPEDANSIHVTKFRFLRQTGVGMSREQVAILLGPPVESSGDQGRIESAARRYWPDIKGKATELWTYPLGWNYYFAGERLIDITQYLDD